MTTGLKHLRCRRMSRAADPELKIYSKQLGMIDLNQFLKRQGANMDSVGNSLWTPMAVSEDGSVIGGWAYGNLGNFGWVVQMPKAFVCHINPSIRIKDTPLAC